jgi:hypothetical protein
MRPPDPQNARRPSSPKPGPVSQSSQFSTDLITDLAAERQARSLCRDFAIGYHLAVSLVPLIWGACSR